MKKFLLIAFVAILAVGLLACAPKNPAASSIAPSPSNAVSTAASAGTTTLHIGMYADGADSYYQVMHDTLQACANDDTTCKWTVDYKVGQNTAAEQLAAVEDFITAKYDAMVVIQNSVDTTSESIAKAKAAGIPYFGAAHSFANVTNATDAAGSVCFDFVDAGRMAGVNAVAHNVKKLVMIEGQLGQGSASDQTLGFLLAYQEAGKNMGGVSANDIAAQKTAVKQDGKQDITVVSWNSGGWFADPAQKAMADAITSLGATGFDGVYAQNDPMMEGVLAAFTDAGLDPTKYWLGGCNGREESWAWVKAGTITMDVNQSAALEGDTLYQQIKAYFTGAAYRKYVHPYLTEYDASNVNTLNLVPFTNTSDYMTARDANKFVHDINNQKFVDIADMGNASPPAAS